ncbi:insulinase family protein, partial [Reichenbachiella sp.]
YVKGVKKHFLVGEPKLGADLELQFVQSSLPQITADQINTMVKKWNTDENMVITIQGPSIVDFIYPNRDEISALLREIRIENVEAFVDHVVTEPLMAKEPTSGKVVSTTVVKGMKAKEYVLSNGAKVVVYPTDKNKNQILFQAYSPGGKSLIDSQDLPSSDIVTQVAEKSGIGNHNLEDLRQLLVGKQIRLRTKIDTYSESLVGLSTPEDIETLLQLIHLTFEFPKFEKESYETITSQMKLQFKNVSTNLKKVFFDSVKLVSAGGQLERRPLQNLAYMDDVKFDRMEQIYKDRFKDAGDFVFVFVGAIEEASFIPMVEKYIASISDSGRREVWKDDDVRSFGNGYEKVFAYAMETPKQTNYIKYQGERTYTRKDELILMVAKGILSERYFKTVREQEGGSYGVGVYNNYSNIPYDNYSMTMNFDCNPEKAEKLVEIIHQQMKNLIANGANEEEFKKSLEGMMKTREQSMEQNQTLRGGIVNQYSKGVNTALTSNYEDILTKLTLKKFNKAIAKIMANSNTLSVIMKPKKD